MIVCSCNRLTDSDIRGCCGDASGVAAVYRSLGCAPQCGRCAATINAILQETREANLDCDCMPGRCACAAEPDQEAA